MFYNKDEKSVAKKTKKHEVIKIDLLFPSKIDKRQGNENKEGIGTHS